MLPILLLTPLVAALFCLALTSDKLRRLVLVLTAGSNFVLCLGCIASPPPVAWAGLLDLDAPGKVFLVIASTLFLAASVYAVGYLAAEVKGERNDFVVGSTFRNLPERTFTMCLLFFLTAMNLVATTQHLGLLWVAVEATTLASSPLICFHRHQRSLEATWKYLLICSVGIALALMGNILLSIALGALGNGAISMNLADVLRAAPRVHPSWLKAAFIFLLVGYGAKMGLAPIHNWLPDAHSEAPSLVSALLSGALLNCAFLGILRAHQVCVAGHLGDFSGGLMVLFGLVSMVMAAVFIVGQGDFKRLLAYSSVEHMGILALGVGLGGQAVYGAMLHAVNHSLAKAGLFFLSGNILALYHTKSCYDTRGVLRALPITGALWVALFLAIAGSPPFGLFISEFTLLQAMLDHGRYGVAVIFLVCLGVIFVGMSLPMLRMVQGPLPRALPGPVRESMSAVVPSLVLAALVLLLGLTIPPSLADLLAQAARTVAGGG